MGKRQYLEDLSQTETGLKEVGWAGVEWIHLAQNTGKCAGC